MTAVRKECSATVSGSFTPAIHPPAQFAPCKKPVKRLAPFPHPFYFNPCWNMFEIDTGGGLVHLLSSTARGSDELLFNILLMDPESFHPLLEPSILFFTHGK